MKDNKKIDLLEIKALTFDVFGTVVDWRGSIIREGEAFGAARGLDVDWAKFADKWRGGYGPSMNRVRQGELPWLNIDALHRMISGRTARRVRDHGVERSGQRPPQPRVASPYAVVRRYQWAAAIA